MKKNQPAKRDSWELLMMVLENELVRIIYIWGAAGLGKTYCAYRAGRVQNGFYAVTLTEDTSAAELRGHFVFKGGDAVFHYGPFVRAMLEGKRLVINELSNANADVLALLFPILESWETAELTLPNGETVRPAPGFHVVVTDNRPPDKLPLPLQDRFVCYVRVDEPHPDALGGIAEDLRRVAIAGNAIEDERRVSARGWRNLDMLRGLYGLHDGCLLAFGPDRGQMVYDALRLAGVED